MPDYHVLISGFSSIKSAKEFYHWFEGQGEQETDDWFECRHEKDPEMPTAIYTDMSKKMGASGNEVHFWIRESHEE